MRPIDLQDNLSKAPLAGREQAVQQSSSELGQRQVARALDEERVLDQSRVKEGAESEAAENRVDREGERRGGGRRQHHEHDGDDATGQQAPHQARPRPAGFSRQIDVTA